MARVPRALPSRQSGAYASVIWGKGVRRPRVDPAMKVQEIAAFSNGARGGNAAGVVISKEFPTAEHMQKVASQVGFSETVFAVQRQDKWRVRYFAPEIEVPFCGHATIALGAALASAYGDGIFNLQLNDGEITVSGKANKTDEGVQLAAALQSPPTQSRPADPQVVAEVFALFGYDLDDVNPQLPIYLAEAGARHLILGLRSREKLSEMKYDLEEGRALMTAAGLTTISLIYAETPTLFHARNAFAVGGVYEDPATGAAAAALGGYLRDISWPHKGMVDIIQGEDMGVPSRLRIEITPEPGAGIRVSGAARTMADQDV